MNRARIWDFWAPRYDRLWAQRLSLAPTRAAIRAQLRGRPPGHLLDMGCGTAQLLDLLAEDAAGAGLDYTGVDASPAMIAAARRKHPAARLYGADLMAFEAAPGAYDTIVCAHAFPYMPDKSAALARLAGWLRAGGRLLLAQACAENGYDRIALAVVKRTTSPAQYLSVAALRALARDILGEPRAIIRLNVRCGVPSLRLLVWEKAGGGAAS